MGWETLGVFLDGCGTLGEVWDGLGDTRGGVGRVGGPLGWSRTGRRTVGEDRHGSWDPRGVRDGSGDIR